MKVRLEHANICVTDMSVMIKFLQTAFPEFRVRGEGGSQKGVKWLHIGTDDTYIALQQANKDAVSDWTPYSGRPGVNHLAYEVDDVDSVRDRLLANGFKETTVPNSHQYRKRVYFNDPEGNDWEFIQYFSSDPAKRNDYETPDS
ncbi:MAG: VOC family protein [candidate division Zixibacteria bacterium]|nr:VOC family protein [candidate division Zixibacteria bacterium]